jgi:hypothetical protein
MRGLERNAAADRQRRWQLSPGSRERTPQGPHEGGLKSLLGKKIVEHFSVIGNWSPADARSFT